MGLLLCCLSMGDEHASLVLALYSGQWPKTLICILRSAESRQFIWLYDVVNSADMYPAC